MLQLFVNSQFFILTKKKKKTLQANHFLPKIAPNIHRNKSPSLRLERYRGKNVVVQSNGAGRAAAGVRGFGIHGFSCLRLWLQALLGAHNRLRAIVWPAL